MSNDPQGALVAIVEDDEAIAEGLALNLKVLGYRTVVFGDGETAQRQLESVPAALVFLDISLPGRSGLWVLERCAKPAIRCRSSCCPPARTSTTRWRRSAWARTTT